MKQQYDDWTSFYGGGLIGSGIFLLMSPTMGAALALVWTGIYLCRKSYINTKG